MQLDGALIGKIIGTILLTVAAGGGGAWLSDDSQVVEQQRSEIAECGVLLEQQRKGFNATLAEIVKQIGN